MLKEAYLWDSGLSSSWDRGIGARVEEKLYFLYITQHCSLIPAIIQHALIASVCPCKTETESDLVRDIQSHRSKMYTEAVVQ